MNTKIEDLKKGTIVNNGKITKIYYSSGVDIILYETDKSGNVTYRINGSKINASNLNCLKPLIIKVDSLLTTKKDKRKYAQTKANAIADCLQGYQESGIETIEKLLINIKKYKLLKARLTYMLSTIAFVILNLILTALINTIWKEQLPKHLVLLFTVATFGSMGGLISVLTKIPKLDLDIEGSSFLQAADGFSRIFLSMISSIIIYTLIKSNIILGAFNEISNLNIIYAFSIISGFSEKFIPDIIKSIETKKTEN
jgi:hypothetical protein